MTTASSRPKSDRAEIAAIAAHLREHGPVPGCKHIFWQLIDLAKTFPDITVADYIAAAAIAVRAEAEAS